MIRCPVCQRNLDPGAAHPYAPICSEACRREALLQTGAAEPEPQEPGPQSQFDNLRATHLYCGTCRRSMPARERLLLTLPSGDLFGYFCQACGSDVGTRTSKESAR